MQARAFEPRTPDDLHQHRLLGLTTLAGASPEWPFPAPYSPRRLKLHFSMLFNSAEGPVIAAAAGLLFDGMRSALKQPEMLYQNAYVWLVFMSAMDTMMTYLVLYFGGMEVNGVAADILNYYGFKGMVAFKFALESDQITADQTTVTSATGISSSVPSRRPRRLRSSSRGAR